MARKPIGIYLDDNDMNNLEHNFTELYNDLGTATGTKNKLDDFLSGTGVISRNMLAQGVVGADEIDNGAVSTSELGEGSVTLNKLFDTELTKNLFNKDAIEDTSYIDASNGTIINSSFYNVYEMNVVSSQQYAFTDFRIIAHYRSDGTFISAHDTNNAEVNFYTTSAKGSRIKVAVHDNNLNTAQIEKGSVQTSYSPHKVIKRSVLPGIDPEIEERINLNRHLPVFIPQKKGELTEENYKILQAFKSLKMTGFDPNAKYKIGFISRNQTTHGYKINIHVKRGDEPWVRAFETRDMAIVEDADGITEVIATNGGMTIEANVDYSLIPYGYGQYIEGKGTDDGEYHDPIMIIKSECYTGSGINVRNSDPVNPPVGYMWILV